jgi:hypothetical protein
VCGTQARAALKEAAKEKSGALASALEARDAARTRLAIAEGAAEQAKAELEKGLAATNRRVAELTDALQAEQVHPEAPCSFQLNRTSISSGKAPCVLDKPTKITVV